MDLITAEQCDIMLANGRRTTRGETIDPPTVVKLFTPDAGAAWLLTELDPTDPDEAFGLCDQVRSGRWLPGTRLRTPLRVRHRSRQAPPAGGM